MRISRRLRDAGSLKGLLAPWGADKTTFLTKAYAAASSSTRRSNSDLVPEQAPV